MRDGRGEVRGGRGRWARGGAQIVPDVAAAPLEEVEVGRELGVEGGQLVEGRGLAAQLAHKEVGERQLEHDALVDRLAWV